MLGKIGSSSYCLLVQNYPLVISKLLKNQNLGVKQKTGTDSPAPQWNDPIHNTGEKSKQQWPTSEKLNEESVDHLSSRFNCHHSYFQKKNKKRYIFFHPCQAHSSMTKIFSCVCEFLNSTSSTEHVCTTPWVVLQS